MRTKRDLRVLCLVCSTLRALAVPNLYRSVDIPVEDAVLSPKHIQCFLAVPNHGVRFIRHLRILGDWSESEAVKLLRSPQRMRQVNVIMLLLLQRTAQNQLQSFEWLLPSSMSPDVMHQLQGHHSSLRKFSWKHDATLKGLYYMDPMRLPYLTCLSAQNVVTADQMDYVQRWITSCTELRKLEISTLWVDQKPHPNEVWTGEELDNPVERFFGGIIERSKRRIYGSKVNVICGSAEPVRRSSPASELSIMSSEDGGVGLYDISSIAERMEEVVDPHHPPDYRLQLDSLKLADFPFLHSASQLSSAINLSQLSSLTLQACRQTYCFLDSWRQSSSSINLKKLYLLLPTPQDGDPHRSAVSVNRFLGAFAGLRSLVLLSRVHDRYPMDDLERHSLTLERLVLDLKITARSHLCFKLNRLASLHQSYHRLTELAIAVIFSRTILAQLGLLAKQLTTLRILNAGINHDPRSQLADAITVATVAVAAAAAPLRVLCMTYNDPDEPTAYDKQKLHVFYVQRVVNILGSGVPVLTRISMEKAEELQGGRVKVLKTDWKEWT